MADYGFWSYIYCCGVVAAEEHFADIAEAAVGTAADTVAVDTAAGDILFSPQH